MRQRVLFSDFIYVYVEAEAPVRLFAAYLDRPKMDKLAPIRSTHTEHRPPSKKTDKGTRRVTNLAYVAIVFGQSPPRINLEQATV